MILRLACGYLVAVDLINVPTTDTGLTVRGELDSNTYPKGIVVSDQEMVAQSIACALPVIRPMTNVTTPRDLLIIQ